MNSQQSIPVPLPHAIQTKDPAAVARVMHGVFCGLGFSQSIPMLDRTLMDVVSLFAGKWPGYRACDMLYHDLEHTLQATVCALKILQGYAAVPDMPGLTRNDTELLIHAVLLHDTGYLKRLYDTEGTGAKYTLIHERRSCAFAEDYLTNLGRFQAEIHDVTTAIRCTGPVNRFPNTFFSRPAARTISAILVTSDYLGQMASPEYVFKLPILYREFEEAYEYTHSSMEERPFKSAGDMMRKTPGFWRNFVRPMLDADLDGVYRCIAPLDDGTNPYIAAVERNIAQIAQLATAPDVSLDPFGVNSSAENIHEPLNSSSQFRPENWSK